MDELIAKLEAQVADLGTQQEKALAAANADGVSAEDRDKHLAEFDRLDAEKATAKASLTRAVKNKKDKLELAAAGAGSAAVVGQPHNPQGGGNTRRARTPAPHGRVTSFRGPDAEAQALEAGRWAAAALYGHAPSAAYIRDNGLFEGEPTAFMGETQNERGGYFVPRVLSTAILELTEQYGVFRRLARVVPMSSETFEETRWTGGMTTQWLAEGQSPTESEPTWDVVKLVAKKLGTKTKMSQELNEDALIDLGDRLARYSAIAFAYAEDSAGFVGDGTSAHGGIVGLFTKLAHADNAASVYTAPTGRDTIAELTMADYLAVEAMYPEYAGADPRWVVTKSVWAQSMAALALASGGTAPADVAGPGRRQFLGYPVEVVNALPKTYAAGTIPVLFGDINLSSMFGDRRTMRMRTGQENDDFSRELITVLATERIDIVNHTITDPKDSAKPGPVVGLKLAAS